MTLVSFRRDATDEVLEANEFNEEPENACALATFEVTYVGDTEGDPAFDPSSVVVADGRQYTDTDCDATTANVIDEMGTLETGGSASFDQCDDVDPDAIERLLVEELVSMDDERSTFSVG